MKTPFNPQVRQILRRDEFPRANRYDPAWVMENLMGPNVLWLAEALTQVMELKPGMRVLDMGCGKAISSIFLAKEFSVQVWATDLWVSASENWARICQAEMQERVFPIHAEAHSLPFAEGFFDAAISLDAYHYFGTGDLYMGHYLAPLVRSGGQIGIVVPGLQHELAEGVPSELEPYWGWEFFSFHSPGWWSRHWSHTPGIQVEHADLVPEGWQQWLAWQEACRLGGYPYDPRELEMLLADQGKNLGFARVVARRLEAG
jgi:cyclopropane fatty-acyl-phospholipid synthase-like methyltransferase